MKHKWRNLFWRLIIINIIGIVFFSILYQNADIKLCIKEWISSFGEYKITIITILAMIDVAIISVFGMFYHGEYKDN